MNFKDLKNNFTAMRQSSTTLVMANGVLVVMLAVSLFINTQKDTVVINNINESCEVLEISSSSLNENGHKKIAYMLASLIGNISPANSDIIEPALMPFIAPDIYQDVNDKLALELRKLKQDEITMSFTPELFLLEDGISFVTGKGEMKGPTGNPKKYVRTYEFEIVVDNYTPLVRYMNVYEGPARDSVWKKKQKKVEERKK